MSTPNTQGLAFWNADAVSGATITVNFSRKENYTATDAASPHHTYTTTIQQQIEHIWTKTATRNTDFATTPGDDEFRIVTGELPTGEPVSANDFPRKLFRQLAAMTNGDGFGQAKTDMAWHAVPYTEIYDRTYTGPGAPSDTHFDLSGTESVGVQFDLTGDQLEWAGGYANGGPFTVDPFTLKKAGNDNFGFTDTDTVANPGTVTVDGFTYDVTAWDFSTSIIITVS